MSRLYCCLCPVYTNWQTPEQPRHLAWAQYVPNGRFLSPSMRQECLKMYMSCLYMVYTWSIHVYTNTLPWCGTRMLLNRNRLCSKQRLASVARLIGPDGKWFVLVNRVHTSTNHVCTYHILVYPCIYHVGLVIVSLEEISQSKCLAVQEWCINLWSNNNLQTGSCENSI